MLFKSEAQLKKYILDKCKVSVAQTQSKIHFLINNVLNEFYDEFTPSEYIRTHQLLHSLVKSDIKSTGNSIVAEVYFDASKLNYVSPARGKSGQMHDAIYSNDEVLNMAMHGSHGGWIDGTPIWSTSLGRLGDVYKLLINSLKTNGIPIR